MRDPTMRAGLAAAAWIPVLLVAGFSPARAQAVPTVSYAVRPGDTLFTLGARYLVSPGDYRIVARLNAVGDPRRLAVGRSLRIPLPLLRTTPSEARIANFRGAVTVESAGSSGAARTGRMLQEGDVVSTGANAFVRLAMADGSHVSLPSRSRVRVTRLRNIVLTGAVDHGFRLESGRIEADVAPVRTPGGFVISTPISVSAVRGTAFRNAYDPADGRTSVEVIEGRVAVEGGGDAVVASEAEGVTVGRNGVRLTDLLPAPDLLRADAPQIGERVLFEPRPAPDAARYRARLATDAGMVDAFAETESGAADPVLAFDDIADGVYFLRLSAVSADGVEGLASIYSFTRARTGLAGLAAAAGGGHSRPYLFRWETAGEGPARFRFQLRLATAGEAPVVDQDDLSKPEITVTGLPAGIYEWRVRITRQASGRVLETWSEPQQLRVGR